MFGKHEEKEVALNQTSKILVMAEEMYLNTAAKDNAGEISTSIRKSKMKAAGHENSQSQ